MMIVIQRRFSNAMIAEMENCCTLENAMGAVGECAYDSRYHSI
jgi:hypothetical protein